MKVLENIEGAREKCLGLNNNHQNEIESDRGSTLPCIEEEKNG